ncbi:MAG: hypothetical protein RL758_2116 [Pseudomonadota bacterium]|jgi:A/G-specific adenine glycosylase
MSDFSRRLVRWQKVHGRHGLPWQHITDPYRVWLSEIMLQQTQVATVLGYYERFLRRFPDVQSLAQADADEVMALWSGLGYYSRARNLHRCAQQVCGQWGGAFPSRSEDLQQLAGIGPSTAAAIAAFCFGERVSILDGNVRRVLARHAALEEDIASRPGSLRLQQLASACLPARSADMPAYTQGLMDLGATLCTPRNPQCEVCPVAADCQARLSGRQQELPLRSKKTTRKSMRLWLWWCVRDDDAVWLQRRPPSGIWAGLHAPPMFETEAQLLQASAEHAGHDALEHEPAFKHVLTHRDMHLHPVWQRVAKARRIGMEGAWYKPEEWDAVGLAAPLKRLLLSRDRARGGA